MWPSHCEAGDPRVVDETERKIPPHILAECQALGWRLDRIRRCWYCDTLWAEDHVSGAKNVVGLGVSGNAAEWVTTRKLQQRGKQ